MRSLTPDVSVLCNEFLNVVSKSGLLVDFQYCGLVYKHIIFRCLISSSLCNY